MPSRRRPRREDRAPIEIAALRVQQGVRRDQRRPQRRTAFARHDRRAIQDANSQPAQRGLRSNGLALDRDRAVQRPAPAHDAPAHRVAGIAQRLDAFFRGKRDRSRGRRIGRIEPQLDLTLHAFVERDVTPAVDLQRFDRFEPRPRTPEPSAFPPARTARAP